MFKMKMMALLKNTSVKRALIILLVIITTIGIITWPKSDADSQISVAFRATSMNVKAGGKDIEMPEIGPDQRMLQQKQKI